MRLTFLKKALLITVFAVLLGFTAACFGGDTPDDGDNPDDPNDNGNDNGSDNGDVDDTVYQVENGSFELGLEGWTSEGSAFLPSHISDADGYGQEGSSFYGPHPVSESGTLESSTFTIGGSGYMTFKLGEAYNPGLTYISIMDASDDTEHMRITHTNPAESVIEDLVDYKVDLSDLMDETVYIRITDRSTANDGTIIADAFDTHHEDEPDDDSYALATDITPDAGDIADIPTTLFNGSFDLGTLEGWTTIGEEDVFKDTHINEDGRLSNRPDEGAIGVLRSSPFIVGGENVISFRLGATKHSDVTYLSIRHALTDEEVMRTYSDRWKESDEEANHLYYADLGEYEGEPLMLEFVDNARGDWGLLTIEDVITHYDALPLVYDEIAIDLNEDRLVDPDYAETRAIIDPLIDGIENETERLTFEKTFYSTMDGISNAKGSWPSVLEYEDNGQVFVITGDIDAMWLRDSSAQVLPYLRFMNEDEDMRLMVKGLLQKQFELIRRDPYANAFNRDGSVFERKFEIDSLAYPLWLANEYYTITGDDSVFDAFFLQTLEVVLDTLEDERSHSDDNYRITHEGDRTVGTHEVNTDSGLIWSGYRPSDDVSYYKFFIPGNMFAVATLEKMDMLIDDIGLETTLDERAADMAASVRDAIETYGVYNHPEHGKMYVFETEGFTDDPDSSEGKLMMDAANIPSLISAPWLGYVGMDDLVYQNTRAFTLSEDNPYYYEGTYASGIGDPHDSIGGEDPHPDYPVPWHMAIAMQALTTDDAQEIGTMIEYMTDTTGGTYVMHEAFNADNPEEYSRDWFTWPCALYAQVYLDHALELDLP